MKKVTFLENKSNRDVSTLNESGTTGCYMLCCTGWMYKGFQKYEHRRICITDPQLQPNYNYLGLWYPGIQQNIFGEEGDYQLTQNLNADSYSGYYMSPDPFRGNINNQSYSSC